MRAIKVIGVLFFFAMPILSVAAHEESSEQRPPAYNSIKLKPGQKLPPVQLSGYYELSCEGSSEDTMSNSKRICFIQQSSVYSGYNLWISTEETKRRMEEEIVNNWVNVLDKRLVPYYDQKVLDLRGAFERSQSCGITCESVLYYRAFDNSFFSAVDMQGMDEEANRLFASNKCDAVVRLPPEPSWKDKAREKMKAKP